jgi:OPA family glycerol-3-phosphate transporter-like MFS transporter
MISNWWARRERGRAFGFYVFAAGFSSVLTYALCNMILDAGLSWRWLFRLPVLLLLVAGIVFALMARNRPEDLGYQPLPPDAADGQDSVSEQSAWHRYKAALSNRRFLCACLAIGFESAARYGLIFWVPLHFFGEDWKQDPGRRWITLALPVGMAFGALCAGQISDRLFASNRSRPIALFMAAAAVVSTLLYLVPDDQPVLGTALLFLAGFFVYGPQASFWALCPDLLGRARAGTGVGVMNAWAYLSAAIAEPMIGRVIDTTGQTGSVFAVVAGLSLAGGILILFVRK